MKALLPGVEVAASPEVAHWVRTGDEEAMSLETGKRSDFYPRDYRFSACAVDVELRGGGGVRVGDLDVEVVGTPGHSDGHLCFRLRLAGRNVLFSGSGTGSGT